MSVRNRVVRFLGLKDVGSMRGAGHRPASDYRPGDRLGIFTIICADADELVLGIDDSHLDVRVSITRPGGAPAATYVIATVVRVHNRLGRLYMIPVGRAHPFVVRAMMRRPQA